MKVTPELHAVVLRRDQMCFLYRLDPHTHVCRDRWGTEHSPFALDYLTVDHVKDAPRMGVRAESDMRHLLAMCWAGNVGVPSKAIRAAEREYLARVNQEAA